MEEWIGRVGLIIVLIGAIAYGFYKWHLAHSNDDENDNKNDSGGAVPAL